MQFCIGFVACTFLAIMSANITVTCFERFILALYSMIAPFDAFETLHSWKYYGKLSICSIGANVPFSMFSKVFKTLLNFFLEIFSMLSINRK